MSESQTKAGNQRKIENLKIKIAQVDPRDIFVFVSRLKTHCLLPKIAMSFF